MATHFLRRIKRKATLFYWSALVCSGLLPQMVFSQIVITSPVNNQVMQRSLQDSASFAVTGYFHRPYQSVQVTVSGSSSQEIQIDESQISQGFFSLVVKTGKGWHRLQMLGRTPDGKIDSASVDRIGIGEVFLVAGNSNAMGLPNLGAKTPSAQVVTFNKINKILNAEDITVAPDQPMQPPVFEPMKADGFLFPTGETSWYWGELGDLLSARLQMPVLFLNAAWAAANSENYRDAASGKDALNIYVGKTWPNLQPYSNLVNTLKYFNTWLGLRAVLWSHGENDAVHLKISQEDYFKNIKFLIDQSRMDSGHPFPWLIALNSVSSNSDQRYLPVTNAQIALAKVPKFNVWPGPDMDTIQLPRPSHGHFENIAGGIQGLSLAAKAWNRSLSDSVFKRAVPHQPKHFIHTGVVPSEAFPGAEFKVAYRIDNLSDSTVRSVQIELLDSEGKFVAYAGSGNESPVAVKIPLNIADGNYRLRTSFTKPVLPGSVSEIILVEHKTKEIQYARLLLARIDEKQISLSWLVAPAPDLKSMVLQKSTDRANYIEIGQFPAINNASASRLYAGTDSYSDTETVFYRIEFQYTNGSRKLSPSLAIFGKNAPPRFLVFPNPSFDQKLYLRTDVQEKFACTLYDVTGRIHPLQLSDHEIIGLTSLQPLYPLPTGKYILRILTINGTTSQQILIR